MSEPNCSKCGAKVPAHSTNCPVCYQHAGFPNVRAAERKEEVDALALRVSQAEESAMAGSYSNELVEFTNAVEKSVAVMARDLDTLERIITSENSIVATFHNSVRSGARIPTSSSYDQFRDAADGTINPVYYPNMQYAALSITGHGIDCYGPCHMTLKELAIADRTSVFEENPFEFTIRHKVVAGSPPPPGYRAVWAKRASLAKAKLHHKLKPGTDPAEFPAILIDQTSGESKEDFIEVHIYGSISGGTIAEVEILVPKGASRHQLRPVLRRCEQLGIKVRKVE